jgi:hypothetical protein
VIGAIARSVLVAVAAMLCGACQMSFGVTQDAAPCQPSPDYFVSDVWPRYLDAYHCGDRGCHAFDNGHGTLRFQAPEIAPAAGTALSAWPTSWRENYLSTVQQVRCDDPAASRLLTIPQGLGNAHPPGPVVTDRPGALMVIVTWVQRGP